MARAQACTYPTAGVLSGYSGQFNGTLSITNNRIGVNMLCGGQAFLTLNALTALVRIDLPAVGSPVMIETCGSVVDTIIAAGACCCCLWGAGCGGGGATPRLVCSESAPVGAVMSLTAFLPVARLPARSARHSQAPAAPTPTASTLAAAPPTTTR